MTLNGMSSDPHNGVNSSDLILVLMRLVFIAINNIKSKENRLKITITPYGEHFY